MRPFRSYTFTWVEIGIFKLAMIAIGIAIGAYVHEFVQDYILVVLVIALVGSAYMAYIALPQALQHS